MLTADDGRGRCPARGEFLLQHRALVALVVRVIRRVVRLLSLVVVRAATYKHRQHQRYSLVLIQRNARNARDATNATNAKYAEQEWTPLLSLRFGRCVAVAFVAYLLAYFSCVACVKQESPANAKGTRDRSALRTNVKSVKTSILVLKVIQGH